MAKKSTAAKVDKPTSQGKAAAAEKKVAFLTAKHWATGTVNQTGEPVIIIEAAEGATIGVRLSAKFAADISKALAELVTKKPSTKTN